MPPRLLFLHANSEDYLADSLLHGLRLVLGDACVDVPRRDPLYADIDPVVRRSLYGRGFTLYGRLPPAEVRRDWWIDRTLRGEFDVVVFGDLWRNWGPWVQLRPHLRTLREQGVTLVGMDGGDGPVMYPYGPTWWKQMRPWPLPRAHGRMQMFKRELMPLTALMAGRPRLRGVRPIGFSIPEDVLATGEEPKTKLLPRHVTDPEITELVAGTVAPATQATHPFEHEADYLADLRASRFGITTKKAGWETLRHYEIAASGCVPCFRDLDKKPRLSAPLGLDASNSITYADPRALLRELEAMDDERYARLRRGALDWARRNTTRARAHEVLAAVGHPVAPTAPGLA